MRSNMITQRNLNGIKYVCLRRVSAYAMHVTGQSIPKHLYDDLRQICDIKLWHAQQFYDGRCKFSTYAFTLCMRALRLYVNKNMYTISSCTLRKMQRIDMEFIQEDPETIDIPYHVLSERQIKILTLKKTMTFKEIAQKYGVTYQRIQQIYKKALSKLRSTYEQN